VFEGFALDFVDAGEATLRVRHGGTGPPVLLLHGHPRTHATWHRVAPLLARRHAVVCPDLRGYGESSKPPTTPDHEPYSKARDGARLYCADAHARPCAFRCRRPRPGRVRRASTALDHPASVDRLAVLDAVPIGEALARCGARFAASWWHWFFFGQLEKPAERVIAADPDAWYKATSEHMGQEAYADFQRAIHDPETVHAMMEDYRAGLGIDRRHDDDDRRAQRRVLCPALVLWATGDDLPDLYGNVLDVWKDWADDLRGAPIASGHHMAEEAPDALAAELLAFLDASESKGL
jgi:haloacetate dehalogenase